MFLTTWLLCGLIVLAYLGESINQVGRLEELKRGTSLTEIENMLVNVVSAFVVFVAWPLILIQIVYGKE